jgi:1,6-anhydro-N-acetylmuramate kinase
MKKFFICAALVLLCLPVCAKENKVAVVISRISYQMDMENVGAAAKAWTAVSSLAGMPYDCFFAEDLKGKFLSGMPL